MKSGKKKIISLIIAAAVVFAIAGTAVPAFAGTWYQNETGWWYLNDDGTGPADEWLYDNGEWYLFDEEGYMITGWAFYNGNWYFLDADGAMATGRVIDDGTMYYMDSSGVWTGRSVYVGGNENGQYANPAGRNVTAPQSDDPEEPQVSDAPEPEEQEGSTPEIEIIEIKSDGTVVIKYKNGEVVVVPFAYVFEVEAYGCILNGVSETKIEGSVTGGGEYKKGEKVTLTAESEIEQDGKKYHMDHWEAVFGGGWIRCGDSTSLPVVVTQDSYFRAVYLPN